MNKLKGTYKNSFSIPLALKTNIGHLTPFFHHFLTPFFQRMSNLPPHLLRSSFQMRQNKVLTNASLKSLRKSNSLKIKRSSNLKA